MKKDDEFRQLVRDRLTMGQDMDLKASVDACIEMGK